MSQCCHDYAACDGTRKDCPARTAITKIDEPDSPYVAVLQDMLFGAALAFVGVVFFACIALASYFYFLTI